VASAESYSRQVNTEMENNYCVFIVNYVYCLCTGTVLILWKLQLNLHILDVNSVKLVGLTTTTRPTVLVVNLAWKLDMV